MIKRNVIKGRNNFKKYIPLVYVRRERGTNYYSRVFSSDFVATKSKKSYRAKKATQTYLLVRHNV